MFAPIIRCLEKHILKAPAFEKAQNHGLGKAGLPQRESPELEVPVKITVALQNAASGREMLPTLKPQIELYKKNQLKAITWHWKTAHSQT